MKKLGKLKSAGLALLAAGVLTLLAALGDLRLPGNIIR